MDISNIFDDGIALFSSPEEETVVESDVIEEQQIGEEISVQEFSSSLDEISFYESVSSGELQYLTVTDITGGEVMDYAFGGGAFVGMMAAGVMVMISLGVAVVLRVFKVV